MPLYRLKSGKIEPKEKSPATATKVIEVIGQDKVIASTTLEKYRIPESALPNLQSCGIVLHGSATASTQETVVHPVVHEQNENESELLSQDDRWDACEMEYTGNATAVTIHVFPMTRMTKQESICLRCAHYICAALRINPFGRIQDILRRAHTAADEAGLQIFVDRDHWFPSLQDLTEMIEQVADEEAIRQHRITQLQYSAWQLSQPSDDDAEYAEDNDAPTEEEVANLAESVMTPVAHPQADTLYQCAMTNTAVAQPRHSQDRKR